MSGVPPQGSENRQQILPAGVPAEMSFFGSSYNPADDLKAPPDIGVRAGDNLSDVIGAVKGVAYYVDTIGFGQSTSNLTSDMGLKPPGVNYFLPTGQTCSNGAEMYQYIEGIPKGDALGKKVKDAMSAMGLPGLRGLAPGMLEDAQGALNPMPLMGAVFGSGYPVCQEAELPVGNSEGITGTADAPLAWIGAANPAQLSRRGGLVLQKAWIQAIDKSGKPLTVSREVWEKTPKTHNRDGTLKKKEGFATYGGQQIIPYLVIGAALLVGFAIVSSLQGGKKGRR
jgi:hypothetical protein